MNKLLGAKIGIVLTSLTLILSIFAFSMISGSVAWLRSVTEVGASGMSVTIHNELQVTATLNSYPVSNITQSSYTADMSHGEVYELPVHDDEAIMQGDYKKALVLEIVITALESTHLEIVVSAEGGANTVISEENFISNCISIKQATISGSVATLISPTTPSQSTFVTLQSQNAVKTNQISLISTNVSKGENKFYFVLEYDYNLINYIADGVMAKNPDAELVEYTNDLNFYIHS